MWPILSKTWRISLIPIAALAMFLGAYFYFYTDTYDPPPAPDIPLQNIRAPLSTFNSYVEPPPIQSGLLVVDAAHRNDMTEGEISVLLSLVADRGYDVEFIGDIGSRRSTSLSQRLSELDEVLRRADSLAVILPRDSFISQEVDMIERYVDKGGKLLLIADPTRDHDINSLADRFGVAFQTDYLYNVAENDINFQDIFIRNFEADEITNGLGQIALYTAGSIRSSGAGLAFGDANTRSSLVERVEPFYPLVKEKEGRVLAIADLTFMIPPQNAILDNDRLLFNIAGYLTTSQREFELADFPHFFDGEADILLGGASLFDVGTQLKSNLLESQIASEIKGVEDLTEDTVFLGLYDDSAQVAQYLGIAGIQVDETLRTPFTPDIDTDGTALILLHRARDRRVLVILGSSRLSLLDMVRQLDTGGYRSGLVSDFLGIYRSFR